MTKTIKGFFFDLDGTLVDTHESNFRAYAQAIHEVKGVKPNEDLRRHIKAGESSVDFLPKVVTNITSEEVDAVNQKKKQYYPNYLDVSSLNDYLTNFLQQMSEHYVVALVTTAKKANGMAVLKEHGIDKYFNFEIFGDDVSHMKPNPEAYLLALQRSGLAPDEVIAFEDSQKGIDAAVAAGIQTIHIRNFQ